MSSNRTTNLPATQAQELGRWCLDQSKQYANKSASNNDIEQFGQSVFSHVQSITGNSNMSGQTQAGLYSGDVSGTTGGSRS